MWASTRVLGTTPRGNGIFTTTIGSENKLTNKKLEGHNEREGKDLLMITKQEEVQLTEILDKYITNIVNRSLNG